MDQESIENAIPFYLGKETREGIKRAFERWKEKPIHFYIEYGDPEAIQGDGLAAVQIFNPDTGKPRLANVVVISNSCDIAQTDPKGPFSKILVAPLIDFEKYISSLEGRGLTQQQIKSQVTDIKNQEVTHLFHFPKIPNLGNKDYIISLNDLYSIHINSLGKPAKKTFTMHQEGFYLFIFKLSIHFCRFSENLKRA